MGHRPLTLPAGILVFVVIGLFVSLVLRFGGHTGPEEHPLGNLGLLACAIVGPLCYWWHRAVVSRPDLVPDVLSQLINPAFIRQIGVADIAATAVQKFDRVRFTVLAQNRCDTPTRLTFSAQPRRRGLGPLSPPELEFDLPAEGVFAAMYEVGLASVKRPFKVKIDIDCDAPKPRGARQLIKTRRPILGKPLSSWMIALALLGGHIMWGGGSFVELSLAPFEPQANAPQDAPIESWQIRRIA